MFSFFRNLMNPKVEEIPVENTMKNSILRVLNNQKILFTEILNGINFNINDEYNILIPNNFNIVDHIQIKKILKDKKGNCIDCVYLYKYNKTLHFMSRIKFLDNKNLKTDEDDSRIETKLLKIVEDILENINKDYNKKTGDTNLTSETSITKSDVIDYKMLVAKSKLNNINKLTNLNISDS